MKRPIVASLLGLLFLVASVGRSHAITISSAKIENNIVQVKGGEAKPLALLTWDGHGVAHVTKRGKFDFATLFVPPDCVADLSDGTSTVPVVIEGCSPVVQGEPGPKDDKRDPALQE